MLFYLFLQKETNMWSCAGLRLRNSSDTDNDDRNDYNDDDNDNKNDCSVTNINNNSYKKLIN